MPLYSAAGDGVQGSTTTVSKFPKVKDWAPSTTFQESEFVLFAGQTGNAASPGLYQMDRTHTFGATFTASVCVGGRPLAPQGPRGEPGPTPAPASYFRPVRLWPTVSEVLDPEPAVPLVTVTGGNTALQTDDRDTSEVTIKKATDDLDSRFVGVNLSIPAPDLTAPGMDPNAILDHLVFAVIVRTTDGPYTNRADASTDTATRGTPLALDLYNSDGLRLVGTYIGDTAFGGAQLFADNTYQEFRFVLTYAQVNHMNLMSGLRMRITRQTALASDDYTNRITAVRFVAHMNQAWNP